MVWIFHCFIGRCIVWQTRFIFSYWGPVNAKLKKNQVARKAGIRQLRAKCVTSFAAVIVIGSIHLLFFLFFLCYFPVDSLIYERIFGVFWSVCMPCYHAKCSVEMCEKRPVWKKARKKIICECLFMFWINNVEAFRTFFWAHSLFVLLQCFQRKHQLATWNVDIRLNVIKIYALFD